MQDQGHLVNREMLQMALPERHGIDAEGIRIDGIRPGQETQILLKCDFHFCGRAKNKQNMWLCQSRRSPSGWSKQQLQKRSTCIWREKKHKKCLTYSLRGLVYGSIIISKTLSKWGPLVITMPSEFELRVC